MNIFSPLGVSIASRIAEVLVTNMKLHIRLGLLVVMALAFGAGCSALPGLRVLTNTATGDAAAEQIVQTTDLVMGDKTGLLDPALSAAADRIEVAAARTADIIEIRRDINAKQFVVNLLIPPPDSTTTNAALREEIRRALELTWQGTMNVSEDMNSLKVSIIIPVPVSTLDKGSSFVGLVFRNTEISRSDAVRYLNQRPTSAASFADLIAQGGLSYTAPSSTTYYEGQPNHPAFMLAMLTAATASQ